MRDTLELRALGADRDKVGARLAIDGGKIRFEPADAVRHHVDPVVGLIAACGARETADQRVVKKIFVGMQPHKLDGIPGQYRRNDRGDAAGGGSAPGVEARQQSIAAHAGEDGKRRYDEQKVPQPGERRPMADDIAEHRKGRRERDQCQFPR